MKSLAVAIASCIVLFALPQAAGAQTIRLGEAMVFYVPDLKPDADVKAFEAYVAGQVAPAWAKQAPGMTLTLVKKDRGNRQGKYMLVWTTDTLAHHQRFASASGEFPFTPTLTASAGDFRTGLAPFLSGPGKYVEYHLVSPEKVGAPLPEVDVLGNHYIKVQARPRAGIRSVRWDDAASGCRQSSAGPPTPLLQADPGRRAWELCDRVRADEGIPRQILAERIRLRGCEGGVQPSDQSVDVGSSVASRRRDVGCGNGGSRVRSQGVGGLDNRAEAMRPGALSTGGDQALGGGQCAVAAHRSGDGLGHGQPRRVGGCCSSALVSESVVGAPGACAVPMPRWWTRCAQ